MADKRLLRLAAGALLLSHRHAEKAMRAAAQHHIAEAAAQVEAERQDRRAAVLLVLLAAGKRMADGLAGAIVTGRQAARKSAARRLAAELEAADVGIAGSVRPLFAAGAIARAQEDAAKAAIAAESLAAQWRGIATAVTARGESHGGSPYRSIARTAELLKPRIQRTAETETGDAYNDEHRESLRDLVRYGELEEDVLVREWSAMLDACPRCWPHHGEQTAIGESFAGGDEPGLMHARCRCIDVVVPATTARIRRAA